MAIDVTDQGPLVKPEAKFAGTLTSDGEQTTPGASTEFNFIYWVGNLLIEATDALTYTLNDETAIHALKAGQSTVVKDMMIKKLTIIESGVKYSYEAMHI